MPSSSSRSSLIDDAPPQAPDGVVIGLACVAIGLPMWMAFNLPPSATFLNQAAAFIGWGALLVVLAASRVSVAGGGVPAWRFDGLRALQLALAILLLAALASPLWAGLPWALALSAAGSILAAALTASVAAAVQRGGLGHAVFRAFCIGLVVAGVVSCGVGILQVFAPGVPDGDWVARTYIVGRAVGNMRQPNHLSSLLVWAVIATIWLTESGTFRRWVGEALTLLLIFVIVLTASRTGAVSVGVLLVWGAVDGSLSKRSRVLLLLAPVFYYLFWLGLSAWADYSHMAFGGETRFTTKGDISSSRWGIWSNTLSLIRMHPFAGVGFGEFNFAWTLTPFPGRPVAFFDHTHNILLQLIVELGLPLGCIVLGLLGFALYAAWDRAHSSMRRAAFMIVLMIVLHSLFEYPLWYAYFLLPAAFAFGFCLGQAGEDEPTSAIAAEHAKEPATTRTRPLLIASMLLMLGGVASVLDYSRVVVIFSPGDVAEPLALRIRDGQRSVFFAHQADYASATTAERTADVLPVFKRAPHNLLDARLMIAWAKALAESGDTDKARYVAQRLKEFHNEQAAEFFAPCAEKAKPGAALPFQCVEPTRALSYSDFR